MKKLIIVISVVIILILAFLWVASKFVPGSYPFAEYYDIDVPDSVLIKAINAFKIENPQYNPPEVEGPFAKTKLIDGRSDSSDYWYHIYFYDSVENQIFETWVRGHNNKSTFAFVAIIDGLTIANWKEINHDFGFFENRKQKKKFEERILNPIKKLLPLRSP